MSAFFQPDLTGENPIYKESNYSIMVNEENFKIPLPSAGYVDSIEIVAVGTVLTPLYRDAGDWDIEDDDRDPQTLGHLLLIDREFNKDICKSFTIKKPFLGENYQVIISYQRVFPAAGKMAIFGSNEFEFTPDVGYYMATLLEAHDRLLNPTQEVHSDPGDGANPLGLEVDKSLTNPANYIVDERHKVLTSSGVAFIHPLGGAFGRDTLIVKDETTGNTLVRDVDYRACKCDWVKTEASSHAGGIYEFIVFLKPFNGNALITYHAYGGDVTLYDLRSLMEEVNRIQQFLQGSSLLTYTTLAAAPAMVEMYNEIRQLKEEIDDMRALLHGSPTGSDITNGEVKVKRIASNDTDHHWWSIAELFKVDGSDDIVTADTLRFRIQTLRSKFMFTVSVSVNLNQAGRKMEIRTEIDSGPEGYVPFENYDGIDQIIRPQMRVIWNDNLAQESGVILQLGMALKGFSEEVVAIEDMSGRESAWKLRPTTATAVDPEDENIILPAGNSTWTSVNPLSFSESSLIPFAKGHLVWAGSIPLNLTIGSKVNSLNHFLEKEVDITRITKVKFELAEAPDNYYATEGPTVATREPVKTSATFEYNGKSAYINAEIKRRVDGSIDITTVSDISAGLAANPLYLRHVLIFV